MNSQLNNAVSNFLVSARNAGISGTILTIEEFSVLNSKLDGMLPKWFEELITTYPLLNMEFYYPFNETGSLGDEEVMNIEIVRAIDMVNETMEAYPGYAIRELGYFCITRDVTGAGDPCFICNKHGDNPPVYLVYHDVSDVAAEIEAKGMVKIADNLSQLFDKAVFDAD